jgi:citrate lyase subunit beta/citryl-CoA lyase
MTWTPPGPAWLFCPADRPQRFAKAAALADVVILDLEDGVAAPEKVAARHALQQTPLDPERTVVRINAAMTDQHPLDLAALEPTGYRRIMLAKTESVRDLQALAGFEVVILIESPLGALSVAELVQPSNVVAVMWGAEDLVAGLGGSSSRGADGSYRDVARAVRSAALLAAKAYGRLALDAVYLDIADLAGLRHEAVDAAAVGFDAKVAIHPSQLEAIRSAYAPAAEEIAWAQGVLNAAASERGVFALDGKMVDAPVLRHAEQVLRLAGLA